MHRILTENRVLFKKWFISDIKTNAWNGMDLFCIHWRLGLTKKKEEKKGKKVICTKLTTQVSTSLYLGECGKGQYVITVIIVRFHLFPDTRVLLRTPLAI